MVMFHQKYVSPFSGVLEGDDESKRVTVSCYIDSIYIVQGRSCLDVLPPPPSFRSSLLLAVPLSKINTWKTFLCLSIIIFYMAAKAEKLSLEKKFVKQIFFSRFYYFVCLRFVSYVRFFMHSAVCLDFWFRNINISSRRRAFLDFLISIFTKKQIDRQQCQTYLSLEKLIVLLSRNYLVMSLHIFSTCAKKSALPRYQIVIHTYAQLGR